MAQLIINEPINNNYLLQKDEILKKFRETHVINLKKLTNDWKEIDDEDYYPLWSLSQAPAKAEPMGSAISRVSTFKYLDKSRKWRR